MNVTAPPRPPRPDEPVESDEFDALVAALIEEARQRQRRRRRIYLVVAVGLALVGAAVFAVFGRSADSQGASPAPSARGGLPAASAGPKIAFVRHRPWKHGDVYVMNPDGSGQRRIARTGAFYSSPPVWSPDGRRIAFASEGDGSSGILVMNADGSGQRNLTRGPARSGRTVWDDSPAWSPDGRRIAFVSDRDGNAEIYVMNADGSGKRNLTQSLGWDVLPSWSPDGRRIAFVSHRNGEGEIYVMNADGSGQRNLTRTRADDGWPVWSPDGRRIAFLSFRDGDTFLRAGPIAGKPERVGAAEVYVMNADGSGQRNLTRSPARDELPVWSPDGRRIAFVSWRDGNAEVYAINADGSALRNLTRRPGFNDGSLLSFGASVAWSPDGRKLAFLSHRDGNAEIYVMNADGSGQRNLTRTHLGFEVSLAWSPADRARQP